jgi:copper transport protein
MLGFVRVALAISVTGLLVVAPAGSAAAHAELETSDPAAGSVLTTQPSAVTLTFGEAVELNDEAIEVFDDRFNRVDSGHVTSIGVARSRIRVGLRSELPQGTYTVSWHVSSGDTHPVSGTFRFSVGHASAVRGTVPGSGRNDLAGTLLGALRWMGYIGLLLGPGVLLTALALWPEGLSESRTRRLVLAGLSFLAVSTLGTMLLQGVWASGEPMSALWSAPDKLDTHSRQFDRVYAVRSYLLFGFAVLAVTVSRWTQRPTRSSRPLLAATTASTVALIVTWPLVGHSAAGDGSAAAIIANLVHTFAMTVWLGGLVLILVSLRRAERAADLAAVLPRFSRVALAAVATLVTTGIYMAWREVGSIEALTSTTFGRLLLVKLSGVVVLVLVGNVARLWVKRHMPGSTPGKKAAVSQQKPIAPGQAVALSRGLLSEVAIAIAILAVTAALVVIIPARQALFG